MPRACIFTCIILLFTNVEAAEPEPSNERATATASEPASAQAEGPVLNLLPEFASTIQGFSARLEFGTGLYGFELTLYFGVMSDGMRTFDNRRYVLQWTGQAEAVVGFVAYERPFYALYGINVQGDGEGGIRILPDAIVSPYVGLALATTVSAIANGAANIINGQSLNNLDNLAGFIANGGFGLGAGGSFLTRHHSLTLEAQLVGELNSAQPNTRELGFLGGGLHTRYDLANNIVAQGQLSFEVSTTATDNALHYQTQVQRWRLAADIVEKIDHHFFAGVGTRLFRDQTNIAYSGARTYVTDGPIDARVWLIGGYQL